MSSITNMKKIILLLAICFVFNATFAQEKKAKTADEILKDSIYRSNRKEIMNYSMKDFDQLFFEFFDKKNNPAKILTKEEFYSYTVKIAIFSDRLAALYPKEKETATETKKKWFAESYDDYLKLVQSKNK